jgi:hypothetical protein
MSAVFPVLVFERDSGDLMRFNSMSEMQEQLERIDVENNEYLAWESDGRPIAMVVEEPLWLRLEPKAEEPDIAGLWGALERFAECRGVRLEGGHQNMSPLALYDQIIGQKPAARRGPLRRLFKRYRRG